MKQIVALLLVLSVYQTSAQQIRFDDRNHSANRGRDINSYSTAANRIYDYDFVQKKPFFIAGKDSLNKIYISFFSGFDSLAVRCIDNGDTAKYIRVHFEFVVDENGTPYDGKFSYIGTTRYASSSGDKKVKYFDDLKDYFNSAVKKMIQNTPFWKPALQNNLRVSCMVKDSFQFWLGISPEPR